MPRRSGFDASACFPSSQAAATSALRAYVFEARRQDRRPFGDKREYSGEANGRYQEKMYSKPRRVNPLRKAFVQLVRRTRWAVGSFAGLPKSDVNSS